MEIPASIEALVRGLFTITRDYGPEWDALCPVHEDRNPSARVNIGKAQWYCHSCHAGGSIVTLAHRLGRGIPDDISDWLIAHDLDLALAALSEPTEATTYPEAWLARFSAPTDYWSKRRGFSSEAIDHWCLGFDATDGYATYPLRTSDGTLLGVSKRATRDDQERKHRHPRGYVKTAHLFGAWESQGTLHDPEAPLSGTLVLTEGAMDAIAMWDAGYAAVAQFGSTLSDAQISVIKELAPTELCLAYDADVGGRQATRDAWWQLEGLLLTQAAIPPGRDPGELSIEERQEAMEDRRYLFTEPAYRCTSPSKFRRKGKTPVARSHRGLFPRR